MHNSTRGKWNRLWFAFWCPRVIFNSDITETFNLSVEKDPSGLNVGCANSNLQISPAYRPSRLRDICWNRSAPVDKHHHALRYYPYQASDCGHGVWLTAGGMGRKFSYFPWGCRRGTGGFMRSGD